MINKETWNIDLSLFYTESENTLGVNPSISELDVIDVSQLLNTGNIFGALQYLNTATLEVNFLTGIELFSKGADIIFSWQPNSKIRSEIGYNSTSYEYENTQNSII